MVAVAHAVVDVWAVVVKPLHSLVSDVAVSASGSQNDFTLWSDVERIESVKELLEVYIRIFFKIAWVLKRHSSK